MGIAPSWGAVIVLATITIIQTLKKRIGLNARFAPFMVLLVGTGLTLTYDTIKVHDGIFLSVTKGIILSLVAMGCYSSGKFAHYVLTWGRPKE